jgi:predicted aconitase with swiveling domain
MMTAMTRTARRYSSGTAQAAALVLRQPVSFWGGVDVASGRIIDRSHPDAGVSINGLVLVMPGARGSSSSSSILAEMMRLGTAPAAIVLAIADPILPVGALVAESLYGKQCPIIVCDIDGIRSGDVVRVSSEGELARLTWGQD